MLTRECSKPESTLLEGTSRAALALRTMGRGAYDLTEPAEKKSAMGGAVLKWEGDNQRACDVSS
jgi:hypothetical protein